MVCNVIITECAECKCTFRAMQGSDNRCSKCKRIKTGDAVHHKPTGEDWIVGAVYYDKNLFSWCGWPEGFANITDCKLVRSCTEDERIDLLREMAAMDDEKDHRRTYAIAQLEGVDHGL